MEVSFAGSGKNDVNSSISAFILDNGILVIIINNEKAKSRMGTIRWQIDNSKMQYDLL